MDVVGASRVDGADLFAELREIGGKYGRSNAGRLLHGTLYLEAFPAVCKRQRGRRAYPARRSRAT